MLTEIEDAIVAHLGERLEHARKIGVQRGVDGIPQPAVYVSADDGRFEVVGSALKQYVTLYVDLFCQHLGKEIDRRRAIYLLLEGTIQTLFHQDMGLKIDPLTPKKFRNVTTEEQGKKGLIAYTLELETFFYVEKLDESTLDIFATFHADYDLAPQDGQTDASDHVTLPQ